MNNSHCRLSIILASLVSGVLSHAAFSDYKTFELANGTNDVTITGAYLPVAIEVKSTESNKVVKVDRASQVDLLKKCYDVTTNEIPWVEIQITTNDYFMVTNGNAKAVRSSTTFSSEPSGVYSDDKCSVIFCKSSSGYSWCYTNSYLNGGKVINLSEMYQEGFTSFITDLCRGNGVYVIATFTGIGWQDFPTNVTPAVTQPIESGTDWRYWYTGVAYGNGKFIGLGKGNGYSRYVLVESTDGKNWTSNTYSGAFAKIKYLNGKFWGYGTYGGCGTNGYLYSSSNGTDWQLVISACVGNIIFGNGKYVALAGSTVKMSEDGTNWYDVRGSVSRIVYVDAWKAFLATERDSYSPYAERLYIFKGTNDCTRYYGNISSGIREPAQNGYLFSYGNLAVTLYGPYENTMFSHVSGCEGQDETWQSSQGWTLNYDFDGGSLYVKKYWLLTMDGQSNYSTVQNQRPSEISFNSTGSGEEYAILSQVARLHYSRTTNYIDHIDYEYVTNRIYNVIDHSVLKVAKLVDAQCVEGVSSQAITNRVFVLNGDKLVVEGVGSSETNATKATLICE